MEVRRRLLGCLVSFCVSKKSRRTTPVWRFCRTSGRFYEWWALSLSPVGPVPRLPANRSFYLTYSRDISVQTSSLKVDLGYSFTQQKTPANEERQVLWFNTHTPTRACMCMCTFTRLHRKVQVPSYIKKVQVTTCRFGEGEREIGVVVDQWKGRNWRSELQRETQSH